MAATLEALATLIDVFAGADALSSLTADGLLTFVLAAGLIAAGMAVIALLPWTDQQLEATDTEARQVGRQLARAVAVRRQVGAASVARST